MGKMEEKRMGAKSIMIQGTMSNAGKSILVGGLCRVLAQDGYKVAPFKSQNMALNSYITEEGLEMGRAQVMQAEAARTSPSVKMNPLLLKPTNDMGSQVIVNGEVVGVMTAAEYFRKKTEYIPLIMEAYQELEEQYDIIVIEGAGSPAEINLKDNDIVNMGLAKLVDAPVLLVGDIDRGGVFAQVVGTIELLCEEERKRIKGSIINKFRGDKEILKPGLRMLEERTNIAVRGVIPYFYLDIDDEDSLTERFYQKGKCSALDIVVIQFPRISNFTDFTALSCMEDVSLRYVSAPSDLGNPDAILLPGSKNTIGDLLWMRQKGLEAQVIKHSHKGGLVFGICGGYQMLGEEISDPFGSEQKGTIKGMGLLPVKTLFHKEKMRTRVKGMFLEVPGILKELRGIMAEGYEIHMGTTVLSDEKMAMLILEDCNQQEGKKTDGAYNEAGNVYGSYVHGIFDSSMIAKIVVSALLKQKGLDASEVSAVDMAAYKESQYNQLADIIRENLDMTGIYEIIEKGNKASCIQSFE